MECSTKIFMLYCKCVLYYMPRFSDDVNICGRSDDVCVKRIHYFMQSKANDTFVCDCLPGCFEVAYDAEISRAPLLPQTAILKKGRYSPQNVSAIHIFYKNNFYRSEKKAEIIGFTDFLCKV